MMFGKNLMCWEGQSLRAPHDLQLSPLPLPSHHSGRLAQVVERLVYTDSQMIFSNYPDSI